jgi:hypothetical protein
LLEHVSPADPESRRAQCLERLQQSGMSAKAASVFCQTASTAVEFYAIDRAARLLQEMLEEEVLPHVAISIIRGALEGGPASPESTEVLDWCEIALHVCRQKKRSGQALRNSPGLIVKIIKDRETRSRAVSPETEEALMAVFRRQRAVAEKQHLEDLERSLILEYEHSRMQIAEAVFQDMADDKKAILRKQKAEILSQQERFQRIPSNVQAREIDAAIVQDFARKEAPPFEKWRLRKQAQQAVLAFGEPAAPAQEGIA